MAKKPLVVKATEKQLSSFEKNWASDSDVADRFLEFYCPKISDARKNRLDLEDKWIDDLRLWSCKNDDMGYVGRANLFVPELHAQVEKSVEKSMSALFPGPDLFKAVGINGTSQEEAEMIQRAVNYELSDKCNIYTKHELFERMKILYGTAVYKGGFRKDLKDVFTRDQKGRPIKDQVPKYYGVTMDTVDLFRWYIYPETATLDDNLFIFEDGWEPKEDLLAEKDKYYDVENVSEKSLDPEHQWVDAERLEIVDIYSAATVRKGHVFLTEVWTDFALKGKEKVPVKAIIANDKHLIRLVRNPFWYQDHPYMAERYIKRPGSMFYGFSLPDKVRSQQYQINDVTNHGMDSLSYSLSPITVVDPALTGDVNSMKHMPGARWFGSPEGIDMKIYPDMSPSAIRMVQELRGQFAQFSDTQPGVAPQLQGKARSATQASIIEQNVTESQRIRSKNEEISIFRKMCRMTHSNLKQFMEEDWQIKYQGAMDSQWIIENVTPSDIWGEAEFEWMGASAAEKSAVRSQQLLAFQQQALQMATILGPGEMDLGELSKLIAVEGLGLKASDMNKIFKELREKETVDPEIENRALLMGRDIKIHYGDDDEIHIDVINEIVEDKSYPEEIRLKALEHRKAHEEQMIVKKQMMELKERNRQMSIQQQQQGGSGNQQGPGGVSPMEGNRGQTSSNAANIMTGVRGVEPNQ